MAKGDVNVFPPRWIDTKKFRRRQGQAGVITVALYTSYAMRRMIPQLPSQLIPHGGGTQPDLRILIVCFAIDPRLVGC